MAEDSQAAWAAGAAGDLQTVRQEGKQDGRILRDIGRGQLNGVLRVTSHFVGREARRLLYVAAVYNVAVTATVTVNLLWDDLEVFSLAPILSSMPFAANTTGIFIPSAKLLLAADENIEVVCPAVAGAKAQVRIVMERLCAWDVTQLEAEHMLQPAPASV